MGAGDMGGVQAKVTEPLRELANLACEAAVELDNYSLGRDCNELATVTKLVEWLTENVPTRDYLTVPGNYFLGESFTVIHKFARVYVPTLGPTICELCEWVHGQIERLMVEATINPAYWRAWALSLSEIASAESSQRRRW
jgi:hypothetical protein